MAAEPVVQDSVQEARPLAVPLTEEERSRLAELGITEDEVARKPVLRFAGVFANDPDFMPIMREVFREGRARNMPG